MWLSTDTATIDRVVSQWRQARSRDGHWEEDLFIHIVVLSQLGEEGFQGLFGRELGKEDFF